MYAILYMFSLLSRFVGMIFINSNRKLHLFDNFWTLKTQNTEYN